MKWHYFIHLTVWMLPVIGLQWLIGWRTYRRNLRAVFAPALIGMVFFSLIDSVAVRDGLWFFDHAQILGWWIGWLPFEEVLFFFLTGLLVSQSLILLLPARLRR